MRKKSERNKGEIKYLKEKKKRRKRWSEEIKPSEMKPK